MKATYTISHENLEALNTRIEILENQCRLALNERDQFQAMVKELSDILDAELPCDVRVPPATTVRQGIRFRVLISCINARDPEKEYTFNKANQ